MSSFKDFKVGSLLSSYGSNPKVLKNEKVGYAGAVLHLAPARLSGREVCPGSSAGCRAACLHYSGSPLYYDNKTKARIARTKMYFEARDIFMEQLVKEITLHVKRAARLNLKPSIRLNGTSDIPFERIPCMGKANVMEHFPDVQFMDYTKVYRKVDISNYHLTFSLSETNLDKAQKALADGLNLAVVFQGKSLPDTYMNLPVVDGDKSDARFLDPKPCVVGLIAKGPKGKNDDSGFTVLL